MKRRHGLSLVEVLLALMLMSVVLVDSVILLQWALRGSLVQRQRSEAANLAERKTEELWAGSSIEVKGDFSVSRDGAWLAYSDPSRKLHLIDLHSGKERPLTVPEGAFEPNARFSQGLNTSVISGNRK